MASERPASEQLTSERLARPLANKYRLIEKLGEGGMGSVWKGEHLELRAPVAIKLMDPEIATNEDMRARFLREARATAMLRSPHVVQILDYGVEESTAFIVMELLEGESLAQRLERVGKLSPRQTVRVVAEICRAVGRAHAAGIVHRDLKPDNIFLVQNDDDEIAKVLDFGIAKATHSLDTLRGKSTESGTMLGTPYYMSPEQANGSVDVDPSSDIWALGVITFECLTGKLPFDGASLSALVLAICMHPLPIPSKAGTVPPGVDEWFTRACARDPQKRFPTPKAAARALAKACGVELGDSGDDTETELTDVWNPKWSAPAPPNREPSFNTTSQAGASSRGVKAASVPARPHPWGWTAGVAAVIFVVLGGWWFWSTTPEDTPTADLIRADETRAHDESIAVTPVENTSPPTPSELAPPGQRGTASAPIQVLEPSDLPSADPEPSTETANPSTARAPTSPDLVKPESPPTVKPVPSESRAQESKPTPSKPATPKRKINLGI